VVDDESSDDLKIAMGCIREGRLLVASQLIGVSALSFGGCAPLAKESESPAHGASSAVAEAQGKGRSTEAAPSARPAHFSYDGATGPEAWAALHEAYAACGKGGQQSPIDLPSGSVAATTEVNLSYRKTALSVGHTEHVHDIVDNGHTIQVDVDQGSTLNVSGTVYHLRQFHYHTPSEHTLDGRQFPLEMHFVHQSDDGRFAVVAALVQEGDKNPNLAEVLKHLPEQKGETARPAGVVLNLGEALPEVVRATTYTGSLTTPPCTEGVTWLVLQGIHATADLAQLNALAERLGDNHRPVQPRNGRSFGQADLRIVR
jgi:carbonic anhydrase